MALDITFYASADRNVQQTLGTMLNTVVAALSGTSAIAATPGDQAQFARCTAGEACRVSNNGVDVSATNGQRIEAGSFVDFEVKPGRAIYGMTL